ncbi:DUF3833 domain-containing protein [Roseovarius sp. D22-M7]|uniref:DUF3833 domain-containing protein n=1 Tax=Roseovarius sp. D22-M7 TaxID=3127116 RepID=UPI00300FF1D5
MTALAYMLLGAAIVLGLFLILARVASFAAQRPEDYAGTGPAFDLRTHLDGPIRCEGVIYGPLGRVASRFTGDFEGRWDGNRGVMTEHFQYDSGNTQDREWRLELGNDGQVRAEADDLVGTGSGRQSGASLRLCYNIRLPKEAGGHVLSVTDWMYVTPGGVVVNRSQFRKFGIKVAELVATLQKVKA